MTSYAKFQNFQALNSLSGSSQDLKKMKKKEILGKTYKEEWSSWQTSCLLTKRTRSFQLELPKLPTTDDELNGVGTQPAIKV